MGSEMCIRDRTCRQQRSHALWPRRSQRHRTRGLRSRTRPTFILTWGTPLLRNSTRPCLLALLLLAQSCGTVLCRQVSLYRLREPTFIRNATWPYLQWTWGTQPLRNPTWPYLQSAAVDLGNSTSSESYMALPSGDSVQSSATNLGSSTSVGGSASRSVNPGDFRLSF